MEQALVERMRCPLCHARLNYLAGPDGEAQVRCRECGACYLRAAGIWRMLTEEQRRQYTSFLEGYPVMRRLEGWERDEDYYLSLPNVKKSDPIARRWRIRRRSLRVLEWVMRSGTRRRRYPATRELESPVGKWALDLGAGNGWLSHHLVRRGFNTVALDLNVSGIDSLAGGQLYLDREDIWFGRVQASMDNLPFADDAFALCTISGALYYADGPATLRSVWRILQTGGTVVINDSPVYSHQASGLAMSEEQRIRVRSLLGRSPPDLPGGSGFLVRSSVVEQMQQAGFEVQVISTERLLGRAKRLAVKLLKGSKFKVQREKREEARFPVFVGTKKDKG